MIDWGDLETRNAPLNAFVDWDEAAAFGDGPLSDLTIGVKSNIMVAGLPWTGGMGLYRDRIAARDAEVVTRLRAAGAAILGSLNMHEAALGATTDNVFYGRTHNPHRIGHTPGGSSGGSGAAIPAGLCDVALGTDTLGSVRIPAAYNGVYGLKPTNGAISNDGLAMLEPRFDCIGPLARDLNILARVWGVMSEGAGPFGNRPMVRMLRLENYPVDTQPAVTTALNCALDALPKTAAITLLDDPTAIRMAGFVAAGQWLAAELGDWRALPATAISDELRFLLDLTSRAEPREDVLARTRETLLAAIGDDGVLITPTAPQAAFAHGTRAPSNQADFTCIANIAGLPALAIPAGRDETGLPVSIQLVGPPHSEQSLIDLARTLIPVLGGAQLPEGA
ncbi:Aspartyl-tRNA(Asn)/glutamyl-tRNA(Gln) amidotransferase subunit A [Sphingomonas antarctica]|uniref:amidase n=1 Tax=Sphingomonas antarctica TaxID=2040274 RepID=UPI0039EBA1AB